VGLPIRVKPTSTKRENVYTTLRNNFTIVAEQTQLIDIMKSTELGIILYVEIYFLKKYNRRLEIGIAVN
jgi:hypothetical protein